MLKTEALTAAGTDTQTTMDSDSDQDTHTYTITKKYLTLSYLKLERVLMVAVKVFSVLAIIEK